MHQLTDLPDDLALIRDHLAATGRIRMEGTRNLLDAAEAGGASQVLAQSAAWIPATPGTAIGELERMVLEASGVVLRYGQWYGPGTYYEAELPPTPRVHIDRAAALTASAINAQPGVVHIIDEDIVDNS